MPQYFSCASKRMRVEQRNEYCFAMFFEFALTVNAPTHPATVAYLSMSMAVRTMCGRSLNDLYCISIYSSKHHAAPGRAGHARRRDRVAENVCPTCEWWWTNYPCILYSTLFNIPRAQPICRLRSSTRNDDMRLLVPWAMHRRTD